MQREELLQFTQALLSEISTEVDTIINKADVSPLDDKFKYVHGRAAGALAIMNVVSEFCMNEYELLLKKEEE